MINESTNKAKLKVMRDANKARAIEFLGGKCVNCGNDGTSGKTIDRLEFDHIKNEDDKRRLSNIWNCSWKLISKELEKCQILCRHCHAKKSMYERGYGEGLLIRHGTTSGYKHCRCDDCKNAWADYKRIQWRKQHPEAPQHGVRGRYTLRVS